TRKKRALPRSLTRDTAGQDAEVEVEVDVDPTTA
ncbi:MAG: hypothetical protein AVDCRST_MAG83-2654, partial [uncultured Arthrobacter sp.]